jgi:hypothetical protein
MHTTINAHNNTRTNETRRIDLACKIKIHILYLQVHSELTELTLH